MADAIGEWAKRAETIAAVRELEPGGGRTGGGNAAARWSALAALGTFSIGVPEALGGAGGTAADVAVVAEQLAVVLAPGPVMPTLLASLALARSVSAGGDASAVRSLLAQIAAGTATVGAALTAPGLPAQGAATGGHDSSGEAAGGGLALEGLTATVTADGGLRVSGTTCLVLGAADASHLLLAAAASPAGRSPGAPRGPASAELDAGRGERADHSPVWFVVSAGQPGIRLTARTPVDFSRSLADVRLDDVRVEPGLMLRTGPRLVTDLAAVLAAAEAAGVAAWCCQTAAGYARTRHQFGRPIGSFQAVKHLCAQMLCRAELAAAAASDAARAADQAPDQLALAAAAAAGLAFDAAVDNAKDCIQVLGGIGFTWEHDAHLYLRRAAALRSLLGGAAHWRARTAALALGGARRQPFEGRDAQGGDETSADEHVRASARVVANAVSATPRDHWRDALAEVGYAAPAWPPPYGLSAGTAAQMIIDEELASAGIERPDLGIGAWTIPAIIGHGTAAQLDRFAWPTLTGTVTWCQLFSEPEAGSDLASLRTRAIRADGGGWRLTGQKVWTSLAGEADWAICLARTDPAAPKHKGITFFLVNMRDPGIEVRPLREITGRAMFNEVFLDDVFVPDECVVGGPGDGWRVARMTLATERVAMAAGAGLGEDAQNLLQAAAACRSAADLVVTDQIGARVAESLALSAMDDRLAVLARGGDPPGPPAVLARGGDPPGPPAVLARGGDAGHISAVRKLTGVAHRQAVAETALALAGAQGAAADGPAAEAVDSFLLTRCLSIAGGTSQILLSLVAERVLGLPRDQARR